MRNVIVEIEQHTCAAQGCGVTFWVSEAFGDRRRKDKWSFYCPNGHSLSYPGESDEAKIARLQREKVDIVREKNAEILKVKRECRKKTTKKKTNP